MKVVPQKTTAAQITHRRANTHEIRPWAGTQFWAVNPVIYCTGVTSYFIIYKYSRRDVCRLPCICFESGGLCRRLKKMYLSLYSTAMRADTNMFISKQPLRPNATPPPPRTQMQPEDSLQWVILRWHPFGLSHISSHWISHANVVSGLIWALFFDVTFQVPKTAR